MKRLKSTPQAGMSNWFQQMPALELETTTKEFDGHVLNETAKSGQWTIENRRMAFDKTNKHYQKHIKRMNGFASLALDRALRRPSQCWHDCFSNRYGSC